MKAIQEGFSSVHLTLPDVIPEAGNKLREYLDQGFHGQMIWLDNRFEWRTNPKILWPEVRSIIILSENYAPKFDALEGLKKKDRGNLSVYAHGKDYHIVIKDKLKLI